MKRMMKWAVMLMAVVMLCGAMPLATSAETSAYDLAQSADSVNVLGRAEVTEDGIAVYTTGAGIAFYTECSGDISLTLTCQNTRYTMQCFGVFVDGERRDRVIFDGISGKTTETLTMVTDLEAGLHRVEIVRETEEVYGSCVFEEIALDGTLEPVADSSLLIEFVGDSLTCGYASNTTDVPNKGTDVEHPMWEVGTQTFAYLAAQTLGADFQSVCASGYGVVTGWNADRVTLPDMYDRASYYHSDNEWTFARKADIVVINLGSNDNSRKGATGVSDEEVVAGMKAFMEQVRAKNPDATIVWATGMAGTFFKDGICQSIADLGGEDMGFYFCELPYGTSGGAGHPSLEEHETAGAALVEFLKEQKILDDYTEKLVSVETAEEAIDALDEADAAKLRLECDIASMNADNMTGKLTGLYDTLDIPEETDSFPWWGLITIAAAVVAAIGAVVTALLLKKSK